MPGDDAGPLERAWICCGFRILVNANWEWPEVLEEDGGVAVLMMPAKWAGSRGGRESACGAGITDLFQQRYGTLMLIRGVLAWPGLVEMMAERDRSAAD